jgi:hypothetical protein
MKLIMHLLVYVVFKSQFIFFILFSFCYSNSTISTDSF